MKLRTGILANYVSQIYVALIGVVLVPIYLRHLGPEAYGLVGFFSFLFSLFYLLDMGLTPTMSRESARFHAGAISDEAFKQLFRAMSLLFSAVALIGALLIVMSADWIATHWLQIGSLPQSTVWNVLVLMAISVALRWMGGLYRGVLSGSERMVWLSVFNVLMASARFIGVLVSMRLWGFTVEVFFLHHLIVAILEISLLTEKAFSLLPKVRVSGWSIGPLRPLLRFGLTSAAASAIGVLLLQVDKFLLSGLLPLADYGHFSLTVVVATSVMVVSAPVSTALMPRMARLYTERREAEMLSVYRLSTQLTSSVAGGGALTLAFCAHPLLTAWTGDVEWAQTAWPVLSLYALGYGLWALGAFPYYLQYAQGSLRMYFVGNVVMLCLQVPAVIFAAERAGALGAGVVWLCLAAFNFLIWGAMVHRALQPGLHWRWLLQDVLVVNWPVLTGMALVSLTSLYPESRRAATVYIVLVGGGLMFSNLAWMAWLHRGLIQQWRRG